MFEAVPLNAAAARYSSLLAGYLDDLFTSGQANYLFYLLLDDYQIDLVFEHLPQLDDYSHHKCVPGSKRSFLRYFWIVRCLQRDGTGTFHDLVHQYQRDGLLPFDFFERYNALQTSLADGAYDEVAAHSSYIRRWRDEELLGRVAAAVRQAVGESYWQALLKLISSSTPSDQLDSVFSLVSAAKPALAWVLLFGLSGHPHTPLAVLREIHARHAGDATYKDIIRNLVRNPAFPMSEFRFELYKNDRVVQRHLYERAQRNESRV